MPLTSAATKAIQIYTTTSVSTATQISAVEINYARTAGQAGDGRDWGLKLNMTSTHQQFTFSGVYASCTVNALGTLGRGSAIQGELVFPSSTISRGHYSAVDAEITYAANTVQGGGPCSFYSAIASGTVTHLEDSGYLFEINGLTTADGNLVDSGGTALVGDGGIRIYVNGEQKWLLYADDPENP